MYTDDSVILLMLESNFWNTWIQVAGLIWNIETKWTH